MHLILLPKKKNISHAVLQGLGPAIEVKDTGQIGQLMKYMDEEGIKLLANPILDLTCFYYDFGKLFFLFFIIIKSLKIL